MNFSEVTDLLSPGVALVPLEISEVGEFEIFPEEERLLSPRAVQRRATEFRLGRHAAHLALERIGAGPQPILRGAQREPLWPPAVVGSITHSRNLAIAAVGYLSDTGGIGIDIEDRARYFPGLETKIAGEDELTVLGRMDEEARARATLEIFSAKESIYKAHYPRIGRYFGFTAARIELGSDHLTAYFVEPVDPAFPVGRPLTIGRLWEDDTVLTWLLLPPD